MMSAERAPILSPNVVTGASIILLGVALMLERLGVVEVSTLVQLWPLLLILFGASLVVTALQGRGDRREGRSTNVSGAWVMLALVALVAWQAQRRADPDPRETNAETIGLVALMGNDHRISQGPAFRRADMITLMGVTRLDLRQATLAPGTEAVVDLYTIWGGAVVHVPRDWSVQVDAVPIMGQVRDARRRPADWPAEADEDEDEELVAEAGATVTTRDARRRRRTELDRAELLQGIETLQPLERGEGAGPPPRLVIRGFVMMGGVTIRS